eukprot:3289008-Ditylum_brightwellii.AAC.1
MDTFDITKVCKKTPRTLMWERFEYTRENILKSGRSIYTCTYQFWRKDAEQCKAKLICSWVAGMKEESTIGIGKENIGPNIVLTNSTSNVLMK